eukprot:TRINITY_DN36827_c0_g1_i1.p1 TRINITY_DN36827_c0_g1~~TRINITY_DN36827_c0_g1_i1.p1  ORF type:complete len:207 (-),score=27.76 TRINITY_DN36827_c0_g1_i1:276-896(-)
MRFRLTTLLFLHLDLWIGAHAKRPDFHSDDQQLSQVRLSAKTRSTHVPVTSEQSELRRESEVVRQSSGADSSHLLGTSLLSLKETSTRTDLYDQPGHATQTGSREREQVQNVVHGLTESQRSKITAIKSMGNGLLQLASHHRNLSNDLIIGLCIGAGCTVILAMACCYLSQADKSNILRGRLNYTAAQHGHYQRAVTESWNDPKPA